AEPKLAALAQFQIYDILYQNKRFEESIKEAYRLYQKFPEDKKAEQSLYDIGWAFRELNNLDSSSYFFELLIEKYPNTDYFARALYQTAQNHFDNKHYDLAIQHWNELITKYRPTIFTEKDWEKVELKAEKERKIYEATQERDVEFSVLELVAKAYVKVGDAYQKLGNYDQAIKSYRIIISTYTMLPSLQEVAWVKIAEATQHKEGIAEAVEVYKEAIDANFNNKKLQAKMQYKIAELYQNEKMYLACADAFDFYINSFGEVADQIDFSQDKAKLSVIAAYYNGKDYTRAIAHSDSFIQKYPTSELLSSVLFLKGSAQTFNREYAEAKSTFYKLIQVFPNSNEIVSANIQLGFIHYKEGNYEKALESYEDILTRFPGRFDSSEIFYNTLLAQSDLKRYDEALKSFSYVKFGSPYYP
ncbi:MAG: tetratricopeptide repeat protein, partial [Ignavibacteria bacterium]|nr:tetratricopeptide repeat protein [Ignavibacteria bacterium]